MEIKQKHNAKCIILLRRPIRAILLHTVYGARWYHSGQQSYWFSDSPVVTCTTDKSAFPFVISSRELNCRDDLAFCSSLSLGSFIYHREWQITSLLSDPDDNTGCPKSCFTEILSCDYQKMSNVHWTCWTTIWTISVALLYHFVLYCLYILNKIKEYFTRKTNILSKATFRTPVFMDPKQMSIVLSSTLFQNFFFLLHATRNMSSKNIKL
jgi:hypothetical protein